MRKVLAVFHFKKPQGQKKCVYRERERERGSNGKKKDTCGTRNPSVGLLLLSKDLFCALVRPQRLSCHYPWPSWNNLLRITGAKLNMSLGRAGDVWNRADFSKVFLGRWHLLHRAEQGFVVRIDLQMGFFTLALERPQEGGVSQACQSCLMSSLSYPQVASWVQTSAAEWAPALVRVVCVCCLNRQTEPLGLIQSFLFSASSSPDIYPAAAVGCRGEGP